MKQNKDHNAAKAATKDGFGLWALGSRLAAWD